MEWYLIAGICALVGSFGGFLHVIIPPVDTDKWSVARRMGAGAVVGLMLYLGGADPTKYGIPSLEILAWVGTTVSTGYVAIDVLKAAIEKYQKKDE